MSKLNLALQSYLFRPVSRFDLEIIRIIFYGTCFFYYLTNQDARSFMGLDSVYWTPSGFFNFLNFLTPPINPIPYLEEIWKISFLFCAVGLATDISKWICALLTCFFLGYSSNFVAYPIENMLAVYACFIFAFCNIGKMYSLDSFFFKTKSTEQPPGWPLYFFQATMVISWLGSGIQKVRISDYDWFMINHVKFYIERPEAVFHFSFLIQIGLFMAVFSELLSPLILISKKLKWPLLSILFLFHFFTIITIKIPVHMWLIAYAFWIEPKKIYNFILRKFSHEKV